MIELRYHPLFDEHFYHVIINGKTVNFWWEYGYAVASLMECQSRQDEIFNSFI